MLTIKKQARNFSLLFLFATVSVWIGCSDPGPRALLEGEKLIREGKFQEAIPRLTDAVDRLPHNAQAWNHLGLAYHHAGQAQKAFEAYQAALRLDRNLAVTRFNLGYLHLEANRFANASHEFASYVQLAPKEVSGWLHVGKAQLREAMRLTGGEKTRWLTAAKKSFDSSLNLAVTAEAYNALGIIEVQRNQPKTSLRLFNAALQREPNYPPALLNLAIVYHAHLNDRKAALQKYREYLAAQPRNSSLKPVEDLARRLDSEIVSAATPVTVRTQAQATVTSPTVAVSPVFVPTNTVTKPAVKPTLSSPKMSASVELPKPAPTTAVAAQNNAEQPVAPKAKVEKPVTTASASKPTGPRYQYTVNTKPAPGNRNQAIRFFDEGTRAEREGNLVAALESFQKAAAADPSLYEAHFKIGIVAYKAADYQKSLKAYETALAISPESNGARFNFALALMKGGYYVDAANELEKLLAQGKPEARIHLTLANLYSQNQQIALAREHYSKVLELEPRHSEAMAIRYWLKENEQR